MKYAVTQAQANTIQNILEEWIVDKAEVVNKASNYNLSRNDVVALSTQALNASIILENAFYVKGAKEKWQQLFGHHFG